MRIKIDPAKAKAVEDLVEKGTPKPEPLTPPSDLSIDKLMQDGLKAIWMVMRAIDKDVAFFDPKRETVMNLKDVMSMLRDLKKEEKEFLEELSDEELEKLSDSLL